MQPYYITYQAFLFQDCDVKEPFFSDLKKTKIAKLKLTFYSSTVGFPKPTLVTTSNYLNLICIKTLKFPDFSSLVLPITMKLFLFTQV